MLKCIPSLSNQSSVTAIGTAIVALAATLLLGTLPAMASSDDIFAPLMPLHHATATSLGPGESLEGIVFNGCDQPAVIIVVATGFGGETETVETPVPAGGYVYDELIRLPVGGDSSALREQFAVQMFVEEGRCAAPGQHHFGAALAIVGPTGEIREVINLSSPSAASRLDSGHVFIRTGDNRVAEVVLRNLCDNVQTYQLVVTNLGPDFVPPEIVGELESGQGAVVPLDDHHKGWVNILSIGNQHLPPTTRSEPCAGISASVSMFDPVHEETSEVEPLPSKGFGFIVSDDGERDD